MTDKKEAVRERFIVEYVEFTDTTGNPGDHKNVTLFIRNVGEVEVNIAAIYVNGSIAQLVSPTLPKMVLIADVISISVTLDNPWTEGSATQLLVVSSKGIRTQGYWEAE